MPTYEYECRACDHAFETMHSMTAPVLRKCPKCGKLKLERLISGGAGVIFKGSGFYETDYKRSRRSADSAQKDKTNEKASDARPEKTTESTKSESAKAESKPESKPKKDAPKKD